MTADCLFFAGFGAVYGGLAGWWARGRRERRDPERHRALADVLLEHAREREHDPEAWRRERLAYDTIYDLHREKDA